MAKTPKTTALLTTKVATKRLPSSAVTSPTPTGASAGGIAAVSPPASSNATDLYRAMLARTTNARKRRNLENIWRALEAIRTDAARRRQPATYTYAAVRRELEQGGTPIAESTILNKPQGLDYQLLIGTYQEDHGAKQRAATDEESLALEIKDPRLQARIRIVLQQNRALQHRLDVVHRDYNRLVGQSAQAALPAAAAAQPPGGADFTTREVMAVRQFLDHIPDHLWQVDEASGAILDHREDEIAAPGFVHALRRIAG